MSRTGASITILWALAWGVVAASAAPTSPSEGPEIAAEIVDSGRYQRTLPQSGPDAVTRPPRSSGVAGLGVVAWIALVALIAAVLSALAVILVRAVPAWRREAERPATAPQVAGARPPRGGASAVGLAGSGRFGEAIHALLLDALGRLSHRSHLPADPSWTSRELLARLTFDEGRRLPLTELLGAAERVHFGGEPAGRRDWDASVERFRRATGEEPA